MPECEQILSYASPAFGFSGAILLVWASVEYPYTKRTWDGDTPLEKKHENRQKRLIRIGLILLTLSFLMQLGIVALDDFARP